jgi:hypothetical protein
MSLVRLSLSLVLVCFVWFSTQPARADGLPPPLPPAYNVSGALLLVGNNVCAGLPCTETIAFSFDLGYQLKPDLNLYEPYVVHLVDTWSGALGSFTQSTPGLHFLSDPIIPPGSGGGCFGADSNFIGLFNPSGDEIDIHLCQGFVSSPVAPSINNADLYGCRTAVCVTDFSNFPTQTLPQLGIFLDAPVVSKVTAIPEPAAITLLVLGMLVFGVGGAIFRKS